MKLVSSLFPFILFWGNPILASPNPWIFNNPLNGGRPNNNNPWQWGQPPNNIRNNPWQWGQPPNNNPSQSTPSPTNPNTNISPSGQPSNTNTGNQNNQANRDEYEKIAELFAPFGLDIGSFDNPKITQSNVLEQSAASDRSMVDSLASSFFQPFLNRISPLLKNMVANPKQEFDISPLTRLPLTDPFGIMQRMATSLIPQELRIDSRTAGSMTSFRDQLRAKNNRFSLNSLFTLGVNFLTDHPTLYDGIVSIGVFFLKKFPFITDAAFRIISHLNQKLDPSLTQRALNFLYNYRKENPKQWVDLIFLVVKFMKKDGDVTAQLAGNIIALLGHNPI